MRYREEVMSKIFTYITVIILLGIIAFEAYILQTERGKMAELEEKQLQTHRDLVMTREINYDLQAKKAELEKFYDLWEPYAAFSNELEIENLKQDLFGRKDLFPEDMILAWKEKKLEEMLEAESETAAEQEAEEQTSAEEDASENEESLLTLEDIKTPRFGFTDDQGNSVFIALGDVDMTGNTCLVYTNVFLNGEEDKAELLFELPFAEGMLEPVTDERGRLSWNCIAYNIGDGWAGIAPQLAEEETEGEKSETDR